MSWRRRGLGKVAVIPLFAAATVSGCAGRAPQPVAVVQAQDRFSDRTAIEAEVQANNQKLQDLGSEEGAKVAQNVAAGVAGLFVWPLWFAMDFQGAAGKEETALQSRQQYLAALAAEKRCGLSAAAQPSFRPAPAQIPPPSGPAVASFPNPSFPGQGEPAAHPAGNPASYQHWTVGPG